MVKINKKTVPFSTKFAFKKNIDFYLDNGEVIELSFLHQLMETRCGIMLLGTRM